MPGGNPRSTATVFGHPIHVMLVPIPLACFILTVFSDLAYAGSANMQWANMSAWLLTIGLIFAALAILAGLIDFLNEPRIRALSAAWIHVLGNVAVVVIEIFNAFVHSRDAYTSVVPTGLTLSIIAVLILAVTAWNGASLVYRHRVGVEDRP